jgi:uncharacterized oligopeptide transporter (OPT) family protein
MDSTIIHAGQIAGALVAILTLGGILVKWGIVKPIKAYIDQMTYSIQPHANGGNSLPDVVKSLHRLEEKLDKHIETDHSCK